jgi:hypothetical protein
MNGVVLTFEGGAASGAFEDGHDGSWTAEAQRNGVPYAEGTGDNPLNAVMALAQQLAQLVSTERAEVALVRLDEAEVAAEARLTPEEQLAIADAKQRLAARRAAADRGATDDD